MVQRTNLTERPGKIHDAGIGTQDPARIIEVSHRDGLTGISHDQRPIDSGVK